jgi:hypothetical protein
MKDLEINLFDYLVNKYSYEIKHKKIKRWIENYILIDHDEEDCHMIMFNADEEELEEVKKKILIQLSKKIKEQYGERKFIEWRRYL